MLRTIGLIAAFLVICWGFWCWGHSANPNVDYIKELEQIQSLVHKTRKELLEIDRYTGRLEWNRIVLSSESVWFEVKVDGECVRTFYQESIARDYARSVRSHDPECTIEVWGNSNTKVLLEPTNGWR